MTRQLRELFNQEVALKDKAIEDNKLNLLFIASCDYYFSQVQPIVDLYVADPFLKESFYPRDDIDKFLVVDAIYGVNGESNNGVGDCNVTKQKRCRVLPKDYNDFLLEITYFASFKEVVNYFLEEEEKDNFQLLEQVGAELTIDVTNERFTELRAMLREQFDIEPRTAIVDGEEVIL